MPWTNGEEYGAMFRLVLVTKVQGPFDETIET